LLNFGTLLCVPENGSDQRSGRAYDASLQVDGDTSKGLRQEIEQILRDLNIAEKVKVEL